MFISELTDGIYYIAELSPLKQQKYLWSILPVEPTSAGFRIDASNVPGWIRKQAYRMFYADRKRL